MIGYLRGIVESVDSGGAIIDVGGVGYVVSCSRYTLSSLNEGQGCSVYVETLMRAEQLTLFGFRTKEEKQAFRVLLTVQGVGAKVCLAILSAATPQEIYDAIAAENAMTFSAAEGVGPKLANRIVRELKDKLSDFAHASYNEYGTSSAPLGGLPSGFPMKDSLSALLNLGYKQKEVQEALRKVAGLENALDLSLSEIIAHALKELSAKELLNG